MNVNEKTVSGFQCLTDESETVHAFAIYDLIFYCLLQAAARFLVVPTVPELAVTQEGAKLDKTMQ
ncbi:MAG: hypothetical protein HKN08_06365 [Gammaproteobacteria bacterium]|nr:hypothetical protein [Gammaproteobacteria bacterium]